MAVHKADISSFQPQLEQSAKLLNDINQNSPNPVPAEPAEPQPQMNPPKKSNDSSATPVGVQPQEQPAVEEPVLDVPTIKPQPAEPAEPKEGTKDLVSAIKEKDPVKIEQEVESKPEASKELLQEVAPEEEITEEAEQIGDGDKRTDEVANKALEKDDLDKLYDKFKDFNEDEDDFTSLFIEPDTGVNVLTGDPSLPSNYWEPWSASKGEEPAPGYGDLPMNSQQVKDVEYEHELNMDNPEVQKMLGLIEDATGEFADYADDETVIDNEGLNDIPNPDVISEEELLAREAMEQDFESDPVVELIEENENLSDEDKEKLKEEYKDKHPAYRELRYQGVGRKGRMASGASGGGSIGGMTKSEPVDMSTSTGSSSIGGGGGPSAGIGHIGGSGGVSAAHVSSQGNKEFSGGLSSAPAASRPSRASGGTTPVTTPAKATEKNIATNPHANGAIGSGPGPLAGTSLSSSASAGMLGSRKGGDLVGQSSAPVLGGSFGKSESGGELIVPQAPEIGSSQGSGSAIDSLASKIIKASEGWPVQDGYKIGKIDPLTVMVSDEEILIDGKPLEEAVKDVDTLKLLEERL